MYRYSALELAKAVTLGELTATGVTQHFFHRIEEAEGQVGAFISLCKERALEQAELIDIKRERGESLGKLAGVPIGIKDNIHVVGLNTTCASRMLENYRASFNATVVERIEKEDGIILGKLNMDEFAMGSTTRYSAFHPTYNPWDLSRVPGGSSGGSAAAVSAKFCPVALGSDTGGSIRQPAAFCGVVGFKPSYGAVSRYGLVAFASSLDQIGPLANTVEDVALMMDVCAGKDPKDMTSRAFFKDSFVSKLSMEVPKLIGIPRTFLEGLRDDVKENFFSSLAVFEDKGAHIIDVDLDILSHAVSIYYILASAEAATNLARFDGIRYGFRSVEAHTISDIYELSRAESFGKEVMRRILLGNYVLSAERQNIYYKKATAVRAKIIKAFKTVFEKCEILAMPVCATPAFAIGEILDPITLYLQDIYTVAMNLAYLPAMAVPSGFSKEGLPLGLQIIGEQGQDQQVCQIGYSFQEHAQIKQLFAERYAQTIVLGGK
ncbi:Glutamyl-tRNA(Gln) amidotransferase subunit A,aspartyl/glutamyl-tRNA amidotransferase subunit A,Allophanate hydrolase subunit 2,aspartyl/glutamyl-tRNA(Asn/Gln) amidotransferase, A subunit,Amidase [Chlamydia serpentis]|uniref:Glutamyl-tRNA(Gln) amidotransferase subunit A n=1 Tax=Chlamydia serpentis TaxID=1967782 RepID=A0A2R8F9V1_9CHLA|nr:Asp-tRNA(Asn)/Glu-tRNA(Gln) amidotransferase subunit GatA [Chlamydia serpentis]SPN73194.1 Glutamyl-tRNA(Gln) amidotransferase subunit A,aspartyl/glutamyl-tRNA amidotransferase subunit A,Allophanate hydrolase subunit 2,aspartyl/glutamyl-tRNA(Asn/Gln) amidotransferase, A subunit,Amidase [Chlamydia serpentis]